MIPIPFFACPRVSICKPFARLVVSAQPLPSPPPITPSLHHSITPYQVVIVTFQFEDASIPTKTVSGNFLDQSVLEITEEHDVHLNHNCGGVCACSTCHVYIEKGEEYLEDISDKEEDFIDRAINPRLESRLGCQCIILDESADITVTIPDQKRIIGHEH